DVLWLTFRQRYSGQQPDVPVSDTLFEPEVFWGEGRNLLLEAALRKGHSACWPGYLYYVFLDDDMLQMISEQTRWASFERFLLQELPAVGYLTRTRHFHALGKGKATRGEYANIDHNALAFHRNTLGSLLPYCDFLQRLAVGWSGAILGFHVGVLFSNSRIGLNTIRADLEKNLHRPYGRGGGSYAFDLLKRRFDGERLYLREELREAYLWLIAGSGANDKLCNYQYDWSRKPPGEHPAGPISTAWLRRNINVSHPCGQVMFRFLQRHGAYLDTLRGPEFQADPAIFKEMRHCQWNARPWVGGSDGTQVRAPEGAWCRDGQRRGELCCAKSCRACGGPSCEG
ncbi:unnamed protein product, partial [Effrenium voratum]